MISSNHCDIGDACMDHALARVCLKSINGVQGLQNELGFHRHVPLKELTRCCSGQEQGLGEPGGYTGVG